LDGVIYKGEDMQLRYNMDRVIFE